MRTKVTRKHSNTGTQRNGQANGYRRNLADLPKTCSISCYSKKAVPIQLKATRRANHLLTFHGQRRFDKQVDVKLLYKVVNQTNANCGSVRICYTRFDVNVCIHRCMKIYNTYSYLLAFDVIPCSNFRFIKLNSAFNNRIRIEFGNRSYESSHNRIARRVSCFFSLTVAAISRSILLFKE